MQFCRLWRGRRCCHFQESDAAVHGVRAAIYGDSASILVPVLPFMVPEQLWMVSAHPFMGAGLTFMGPGQRQIGGGGLGAAERGADPETRGEAARARVWRGDMRGVFSQCLCVPVSQFLSVSGGAGQLEDLQEEVLLLDRCFREEREREREEREELEGGGGGEERERAREMRRAAEERGSKTAALTAYLRAHCSGRAAGEKIGGEKVILFSYWEEVLKLVVKIISKDLPDLVRPTAYAVSRTGEAYRATMCPQSLTVCVCHPLRNQRRTSLSLVQTVPRLRLLRFDFAAFQVCVWPAGDAASKTESVRRFTEGDAQVQPPHEIRCKNPNSVRAARRPPPKKKYQTQKPACVQPVSPKHKTACRSNCRCKMLTYYGAAGAVRVTVSQLDCRCKMHNIRTNCAMVQDSGTSCVKMPDRGTPGHAGRIASTNCVTAQDGGTNCVTAGAVHVSQLFGQRRQPPDRTPHHPPRPPRYTSGLASRLLGVEGLGI
eukprot:276894-Rhodomonas_salina.2